MGIFRPSARVKFVTRLEEFADTQSLDSRLQTQIGPDEQKLSGKSVATQGALQAELADVQRRLSELTAQRKDIPRTSYQAQRSQLERQRDVLQRKVQGFGEGAQAQIASTALHLMTAISCLK